MTWRKQASHPFSRRAKRSILGTRDQLALPQVMEPVLLEIISKHMEDLKVTGKRQQGFTNLIA